MSEIKRCPKCNSIFQESKNLTTVPIATNAGTELEPDFILTGKAGVLLRVFMCPSCGFVELYGAGSVSRSKEKSPPKN